MWEKQEGEIQEAGNPCSLIVASPKGLATWHPCHLPSLCSGRFAHQIVFRDDLCRASCPSPYGPALLFKIIPDDFVSNLRIRIIFKKPLIKSKNTLSRHSGACQNLVKTIIYWMLVFTSMTECVLGQRFPSYV